MNPQRYHSLPHVDGSFPGEPMHHQFYPTSPQQSLYVPQPSHQHLLPSSPHSYTREQEQGLSRHSHLLPPSSLPWECLQCGQKFYSEAERDHHLYMCLQQEQPAVPVEPLYESIVISKPAVLLTWTKEKQTLEKEVQLFTKEGEAITLRWSDQERRFQAESRLSAGEQDGLLSVNDINLSAEVHSFYVAETKINAKMQIIELAINDEAEELKKREELVVVEEVGGKAEAETPKKSKSQDLKKKLSRKVDNNQEGDWNARDGEAKKQIKSLQKENEKHSQREAELREHNKKLSADCSKCRKQVETLSRDKEAKRRQLEGEKLALTNTIKALKRESELKQASTESHDGELTSALGRSKSLLNLRDRENTDLSQQLATLQLITSAQENQLKDQQEEIVEERERVSQVEAELRRLQQEGPRQPESSEYDNRFSECNMKSELELSKSQIICESLKEGLSEAAQLGRDPEARADARAEQEQVQLAPPEGGGEETEVRAVRRQLRAVEKELDELVLVKKACELDLERLKERLKLGNETKAEQRAQDPEISKFFQNTIKRKEEELEESKQNLAALREQNLRLEREKEDYFQQLESLRGVLIPSLKRQIQVLEENQLTAVVLSDVDGSLTSSYEEAQLVSSVSTLVGSDQLLELKGTTCSAFTPKSPGPDPPAAPKVSIQELPLPLHLQNNKVVLNRIL